MNARQRKRAARRAAQQQQQHVGAHVVADAMTQVDVWGDGLAKVAAPEPEPEPVKPVEKTPFSKVTWRLRGGFTVTITGPKAFEEDIDIDAKSESIVITTGAAKGRQVVPLAYDAPLRAEGKRMARPVAHGNAASFRSSSRLPLDAPVGSLPGEADPEDELLEDDGPLMQENGMPKAPRDRTRAQKAVLRFPGSVTTGAGEVQVDTGLTIEALRT